MADKAKHLLVITTCPGTITAKKIANEVVLENLGACVQIVPGVQSFFRWVNRVDTSDELLLLIAIPISDGLDEYLQWIETNSTPK